MDPIGACGPVECRCGWKGDVPATGEGTSFTCPGCGVALLASAGVGESRDSPTNPKVAGLDNEAAPPESAPPPQSSGGKAAWDWTRRQFRQVWSYVRSAFAFYWTWRGDLRIGGRRWLLQFLPALEDPDRIRREIRVPLRDDERVTRDGDAWHIHLPGRCVSCGSRGSGEASRIERTMLDPFPLLAMPLAGFVLSLFFGWWYQSLLLFLILLPGGILVGYALRRIERLIVTFERCSRHAQSEKAPEMELWRGEAFLWTGAREVRQAFFGNLVEEAVPEEPDAPYAPPDLTPAAPSETVALADDVPESSQIVHEAAKRLNSSESEKDLFGSVNESLDPDKHGPP